MPVLTSSLLVYTGLYILGASRASSTPHAIDADQPPMEEAFGSGHVAFVCIKKRKIDPPRPLLFRQQRLIDGEPPFLGINRLRQKRHRRSQVVGLLTGNRPPKQKVRSHLDLCTISTQMSAQLPNRYCRETYRRLRRRNSHMHPCFGPLSDPLIAVRRGLFDYCHLPRLFCGVEA